MWTHCCVWCALTLLYPTSALILPLLRFLSAEEWLTINLLHGSQIITGLFFKSSNGLIHIKTQNKKKHRCKLCNCRKKDNFQIKMVYSALKDQTFRLHMLSFEHDRTNQFQCAESLNYTAKVRLRCPFTWTSSDHNGMKKNRETCTRDINTSFGFYSCKGGKASDWCLLVCSYLSEWWISTGGVITVSGNTLQSKSECGDTSRPHLHSTADSVQTSAHICLKGTHLLLVWSPEQIPKLQAKSKQASCFPEHLEASSCRLQGNCLCFTD